MYEPRFYRQHMLAKGLVSFQVVVNETDIHVSATKKLEKETGKAITKYRAQIEDFIVKQPAFLSSMKPFDVPDTAPQIIKDMAVAGKKANVGPMAAVAGAIAEYVGRDLLNYSQQVIVENGGDIFVKTDEPRKLAIYAGNSPLSGRVGFNIEPRKTPLGVCTSSGTVGHSLSLGKADAVVVTSASTPLADAAATSIGNKVKTKKGINEALEFGQEISDVNGIIIIKDDQIGIWGDLELIRTAP